MKKAQQLAHEQKNYPYKQQVNHDFTVDPFIMSSQGISFDQKNKTWKTREFGRHKEIDRDNHKMMLRIQNAKSQVDSSNPEKNHRPIVKKNNQTKASFKKPAALLISESQ